MDCLIFNTQQAAIDANLIITENAKFTGNATVRWQIPLQRSTDLKYWIYKPKDFWMTSVAYYSIEQYSDSW